jgi:apolipoprotein N-acyltransferase
MRERFVLGALLAAGLGFTAIANGSHAVSWAPFLANTLLLLFLDRLPARSGLLILFPLFLATYFASWWGIAPGAPPAIYVAIALVYGAPYFLPFVAHRLIGSSEASHCLHTLVFPSAWVCVEVALRLVSPYGSWMSLGYSQGAGGSFAQLASVGGVEAVTFIIAWFASLTAWALSRSNARAMLSASFAVSVLVLLGLVGWGEWRVRSHQPETRVVTVASVMPNHVLQDGANNAMIEAPQPLIASSMETVRAATDVLNRDLLAGSARAAAAGAKMVAWPEASGMVRDADEPAFLGEASATARANGIYIFASYILWHPGAARPIENKVAAVEPSGRIVFQFNKAHPIVGFEDSRVARGDASVRVLDTPYGRIGLAICHDLDFPELIRQAGQSSVDLFIDPSNDWAEIEWLHANMHRYRAVENGFTLFRPTDHGASLVSDSAGIVRVWTSTYGPETGAFISEVPIGHAATLYSRGGGEVLAWGSAATLAIFLFTAVAAAFRRRNAKRRSVA